MDGEKTEGIALEEDTRCLPFFRKVFWRTTRGVGRLILLCVWVAFVIMVFTVMQPVWALLASLYAGGFMLFIFSGFFFHDPAKEDDPEG